MANWQTSERIACMAQKTVQYLADKRNWQKISIDVISGAHYTPELDCKLDNLKASWIEADREDIIYRNQLECKQLHTLTNQLHYPYHSEAGITHFNHASIPHTKRDSAAIREIANDNRACFEIISLGVNVLNLHTCAKVRINGLNIERMVDIEQTLQSLSRNARRKAVRYNRYTGAIYSAIASALK